MHTFSFVSSIAVLKNDRHIFFSSCPVYRWSRITLCFAFETRLSSFIYSFSSTYTYDVCLLINSQEANLEIEFYKLQIPRNIRYSNYRRQKKSSKPIYLAFHWLCVQLAHVWPIFFQSGIDDNELMFYSILMPYHDSWIMSYYMVANGLYCLCICFYPANLKIV